MSTSEVTSPVMDDEQKEEKLEQDDTAVEQKEQAEKKETTAGDSAITAGEGNKDAEEKGEAETADDKATEESEKMMEEATNKEETSDAAKEAAQQAQSKEEEESVVATTTVTEGETDQEKNAQQTTTSVSTEEKPKQDSKTADETSKPHTPSQDKEREKHKDKRKKKRKSRGAPKLRKRSSKADTQRAEQYLTGIFLSYFQAADQENIGLLSAEIFWEIIFSQDLNLQLTENDLLALQELLPPDSAGMISYTEFLASARTYLVAVYQDRPDTEAQWVEVRGTDGTSVMLNKKTGAVKDLAEGGGFDLFEDTIRDLFKTADTENKGYVTVDDFTKMLAMQEMTNYLQAEDIEYMTRQFPDGKVTFSEFYPIAKELILRVYRTKDSTEAEWLPLSSPRVGLFWFNKFSGETRREMSPQGEREQELMLINQLNAELEACRVELEQEKLQGREWQNQLALANEELERMAVQLDETGQRLDEAHNELAIKEAETAQINVVIDEKEQFIAELQAQVAAAKELEAELTERENALKATQDTVLMKEQSLTERDEAIATLQYQSTSVVDQLKSARGVIDARDSTITRLQRELAAEQARLKELDDHVPLLEKRLANTQDELKKTRATMEEKAATLTQTRRHLKNAREKNKEMETDLGKLSSVHDKLQNAESEIKALKQFVMSKTAMVERRKAEIVELKAKLTEAESKDNRRAIILADVLEKTARSYQQQLVSTGAAVPRYPVTTSPLKIGSEEVDRPCSAPHLPMEEVTTIQMREKPAVNEFSLQSSMPTSLWPRHSSTKKTHLKAKTVPKLPPIRRRPPFMIPTEKDIHTSHRKRDLALLPHVASNPECQCQLCLLSHPSAAAKSHKRTRGLVGGMMGGEEGVAAARYQQQLRTDETELKISQQIKLGIRVLLQTKKSVYDLEPQKLTGVVKYVGKIDSEFLDNRIYVGVRLDEPVGNTDGLFKGKRYFTCTQNHGKMVRVTNIIAVLPPKSVVYRPINLSPYASTQQQTTHKKGGTLRV